ncbi:MAG TPA: MinD/ParA family protein [Defluviitaleaceae bacterium]|nr:MinD/ParA family protein [Defluviitaleaceae bacterium]
MMDQAEKLRKIVNEQNRQLENSVSKTRKSRVITITSGKGGVGKSNFTANLAIQLQRTDRKVVIIDADLGLANIEVIFGIVPQFNLTDVIYGRKSIAEIMTPGPLGINFISGGSGIQDLIHLNSQQLSNFISNLSLLDEYADIILIDTGAGLTDSVINFFKAADEIILVTTPEPTSVTDAYSLIKVLCKNNLIPNIKLLVNRVEDDEEGKEIFNKLYRVSKKFLNIEINELGYLPYDKNLIKSVKLQEPVCISFPNSEISRAFRKISYKITEDEPQEEMNSGFTSFVKRLMHVFERNN